MAGRLIGLSFLAAIGFLLLFGITGDVGAVTYKMRYTTRLSCTGPDGVVSLDDSCAAGTAYNASTTLIPVNADILSRFSVPLAAPKYSNYQLLRTFGTPSGWTLATDKQIPDGAAVGTLVSQSTLALFGGNCATTLVVTIPMYDCTTDNSAGNLIQWSGALNGRNLLEGEKGGLPKGCTKYPTHLDVQARSVKPRARYMGTTVVTDNMAPTQLQFAMFTPQQLSQPPAPGPEASLGDEMGYVNFVVLNNPAIPAPAGDSLDEFCTPLESNTTLWGKTGGQGGLTQKIGPLPLNPPPTAAGNFWVVGDLCNNTLDDDADTTANEMCGIQRVKNPAANKGVWGTGTHMDGAYGQSYRDADGDTIVNEEDECPFQIDTPADPDADFIDSVCDPTPTGANQDPDNDGLRAQQDNCPLVANGCNVCNPDGVTCLGILPAQPCNAAWQSQLDSDGDRIGNICDTVGAGGIGLGDAVADGKYLNDQPSGGICIGAADADGDGFCDATENINPTGTNVLSRATDAGGAAGESDANTPAYTTPLCSDGLDNDSDTFIDAADAGCSVPEYKALDYAVAAAAGVGASPAPVPLTAPRTCDNWSYYLANNLAQVNPHGGVAPEVDEDGDTTVNAADPNCAAIANDTDQDGVVNASDNCPAVWNPTQLDTDGDQKPGQSPVVTADPATWWGGDACDPDDDADLTLDTAEWSAGSDAKSVCDPVNFDTKPSGTISVADVVAFTYPLRVNNRPCAPAANYNICR